MTEVIRTSQLTCPECSARHVETMPGDRCLWFWRCPDCAVLVKPKPGDCCVFCSYGSVPCPPVQLHGKACCPSAQ